MEGAINGHNFQYLLHLIPREGTSSPNLSIPLDAMANGNLSIGDIIQDMINNRYDANQELAAFLKDNGYSHFSDIIVNRRFVVSRTGFNDYNGAEFAKAMTLVNHLADTRTEHPLLSQLTKDPNDQYFTCDYIARFIFEKKINLQDFIKILQAHNIDNKRIVAQMSDDIRYLYSNLNILSKNEKEFIENGNIHTKADGSVFNIYKNLQIIQNKSLAVDINRALEVLTLKVERLYVWGQIDTKQELINNMQALRQYIEKVKQQEEVIIKNRTQEILSLLQEIKTGPISAEITKIDAQQDAAMRKIEKTIATEGKLIEQKIAQTTKIIQQLETKIETLKEALKGKKTATKEKKSQEETRLISLQAELEQSQGNLILLKGSKEAVLEDKRKALESKAEYVQNKIIARTRQQALKEVLFYCHEVLKRGNLEALGKENLVNDQSYDELRRIIKIAQIQNINKSQIKKKDISSYISEREINDRMDDFNGLIDDIPEENEYEEEKKAIKPLVQTEVSKMMLRKEKLTTAEEKAKQIEDFNKVRQHLTQIENKKKEAIAREQGQENQLSIDSDNEDNELAADNEVREYLTQIENKKKEAIAREQGQENQLSIDSDNEDNELAADNEVREYLTQIDNEEKEAIARKKQRQQLLITGRDNEGNELEEGDELEEDKGLSSEDVALQSGLVYLEKLKGLSPKLPYIIFKNRLNLTGREFFVINRCKKNINQELTNKLNKKFSKAAVHPHYKTVALVFMDIIANKNQQQNTSSKTSSDKVKKQNATKKAPVIFSEEPISLNNRNKEKNKNGGVVRF